MNLGKAIRMKRLLNSGTRRTIIVTLDHGVSMGPMPGLEDVSQTIREMRQGRADSILLHKGLVKVAFEMEGRDLGLVVHLSASTDLGPDPNWKVPVATVEEALRLGADAVSVQVNLGTPGEGAMLAALGKAAEQAELWGMPLMAMLYVRGPHNTDPFDAKMVGHAARVGAELGADMVKVSYTGDRQSFAQVVQGCSVPVLVAGGPRVSTPREFLNMAYNAVQAGAAGLCVGRNIFQYRRPGLMACALHGIVHEGRGVEEALKELGED